MFLFPYQKKAIYLRLSHTVSRYGKSIRYAKNLPYPHRMLSPLWHLSASQFVKSCCFLRYTSFHYSKQSGFRYPPKNNCQMSYHYIQPTCPIRYARHISPICLLFPLPHHLTGKSNGQPFRTHPNPGHSRLHLRDTSVRSHISHSTHGSSAHSTP